MRDELRQNQSSDFLRTRRNVLDFTSLLVKSRDLLRDFPEFRRQVQERIGALLVDEFQDTNRLQLELVLLLSERREDGPRELALVGVRFERVGRDLDFVVDDAGRGYG